MRLNDIKFTKGNGGMGRKAASEDPVSALLFAGMSLTFGSADGNLKGFDVLSLDDDTPAAYVRKFEFAEQLEDAGIIRTEYDGTTALTAAQQAANVLHYHAKEFFRMSETGTLYLVVKAGTAAVTAADIAEVQNYSGGRIRQAGVFTPALLTPSAVQEQCVALETAHMPLSVVLTYSGKTVETATLTAATLKAKGLSNVSVLVGCDFSTVKAAELGDFAYYGCIGTAIGAISAAAVNESIAWVQKFPLGFANPALFNGALMRTIGEADKALLNNNYIFVLTHVGDADCYFNDSHTLDVVTSDYAYIENVRTIDKACRGIREAMLPYLNAPLKVDASTGKLSADVVAHLETVASEPLDQMEKAGELSGFSCEIDPEQNVLATSEVEVVIKQVGVGVMRHVSVKIGYTTSI